MSGLGESAEAGHGPTIGRVDGLMPSLYARDMSQPAVRTSHDHTSHDHTSHDHTSHDHTSHDQTPSGSPGFAAVVRERTKAVHRAAERAGFIADLLHGRASRAAYALFLRNLHPAYAAMEPALTLWAGDPIAGVFSDPRLHRLESLAADLRSLAGADWMALPVLPEASAYAAAIAATARDPFGLAGQAYARYLGDLSGGQILRPLLARTLGLGPEALALYDFPAYADLAEPKTTIRAALDAVPADSDAAQTICDAAIAAFRHNIALSEAVQAACLSPASTGS